MSWSFPLYIASNDAALTATWQTRQLSIISRQYLPQLLSLFFLNHHSGLADRARPGLARGHLPGSPTYLAGGGGAGDGRDREGHLPTWPVGVGRGMGGTGKVTYLPGRWGWGRGWEGQGRSPTYLAGGGGAGDGRDREGHLPACQVFPPLHQNDRLLWKHYLSSYYVYVFSNI